MASEVGSGQVAIYPTFKGFRSATLKEIAGAERAGSATFRSGFARSSAGAGTAAGKSFSTAFASSTKGVTASLSKEYATASRALATARLREQDAVGKVRVAEVSLTEARARALPGSARVVAAEERLATASRRVGVAQSTTRAATAALSSAKQALTFRTASLTTQTENATSGFRALFSTLGGSSGILAGVGGGFAAVGGAAFTVAGTIGRGLVSAISFASKAFLTLGGIGLAALTGITAAIGTMVITGGISRALNIEDAQAKLKGLGHTAEDVTQIMNDSLAAVKGTAFALDDAVTVAASAVAAGVKPGEDLQKYLKLTADAAQIAGISLADMGSIINKTTASGKVYTDVLNQLADRGIPIFKWLQDEYGVSADALSDMVSQGQVDAATFQRVIAKNIGGAALAAGNTTRGAFANMRIAMSRLGATLVGDLLPKFRDFFNKVGGFFDSLTPTAQQFAGKFGQIIGGALATVEKLFSALTNVANMGFSFDNLKLGLTTVFPGLSGLFGLLDGLRPVLPAVQGFFNDVGKAAKTFGDALAPVVASALPVFVGLLKDLMDNLGPVLPDIAGSLGDMFKELVKLLPSVNDLLKAIIPLIPDLVRLASLVLPLLIDAAKLLVPVLTPIIKAFDNWVRMVNFLIEGFGKLSSGMNIGDAFKGITDLDVVKNNPIAGFLSGTVDNIHLFIQTVEGGFNELVGSVASTMSSISRSLQNGWQQITDGASGFVNGLTSGLANGWQQIVDGASGFVNGLVSGLQNGWQQIVDGASGAAAGIAGAFGNGWNQIVQGAQGVLDFLGGLPDQIGGFFSGAGEWLVSSGRSIIDGLVSGIRSGIGSVGNAVQSVINEALSFLPHSPAKKGPLSGRGWTQLAASGTATIDQYLSGFSSDAVSPALSASLNVSPVSSSFAAVSSAQAATSSRRPITTEAGTLLGWINEIADGRAQLVWNKADLAQKQKIRSGRR